jgi:hypothetical protein
MKKKIPKEIVGSSWSTKQKQRSREFWRKLLNILNHDYNDYLSNKFFVFLEKKSLKYFNFTCNILHNDKFYFTIW